MQLPNKGSLGETNFFAILKEASASSLTGMVRVESGNVIKVVYMQQGSIAFASSNDKADRLTEVLKRAGKLTPEQIEHAQARMRPNVSLGKTLVELGYISAKDLLWGARTQVEGILHQLLFWIDGLYQVLQGPLPKEIVSLNIPVQKVIFDGVLKTNDRQWVLDHIGSPEAVYSLEPEFHEANAAYQFSADNVVSRLNGKRTLEEVAQLAGMDTFEVCKTVSSLQLLGLARRIDKPVQMALQVTDDMSHVMDETPAPVDLSLGQVMQIPTVAELQEPAGSAPSFEVGEPEAGESEQEKIETEPVSFSQESPAMEPAPAGLEEEAIELPAPAAPVPEPPQYKSEPKPESPRYQPEPIRPPSFQQRPAAKVPLEGLSLTTKSRTSPGASQFSWRKAALIMGIVGLVLIAAFAGYSRYQQARTASDTPQVELKPPKPLKGPDREPSATQEVVEPPAPSGQVSPPAQQPPVKTPPASKPSPTDELKAGNVKQAAALWQNELRKQSSGYTIQLEIACQPATVMEALQLTGGSRDLIVVPMTYQGKNCYRVLFGLYANTASAENARSRVPQEFLRQDSPPKVVPVSKVIR